MRIIGGKYKRRRFDVPKSFNARPTTDFGKENLFNVLQHYIDLEDSSALDLFSGTGSIAVELLSRGCQRVLALEQRREHALFIRSVLIGLVLMVLLLMMRITPELMGMLEGKLPARFRK